MLVSNIAVVFYKIMSKKLLHCMKKNCYVLKYLFVFKIFDCVVRHYITCLIGQIIGKTVFISYISNDLNPYKKLKMWYDCQ